MSCSNCYNGCPQIVSDQCVKYTGVDVPVLGIKNGDSLSYVEQAIVTFLTSTLDGTGVKPKIEQSIICNIVKKYLPTCGDLSVVDFIKALTQAVCELKTLVDGTIADIQDINDFIDSLESAYDVDCLSGVTSTSGTHAILQAVITKLCEFITDVDLLYVKDADLDARIAAYLATLPGSSKFYTKMVPYVAVPFFPTTSILSNFSITGVGSGDWEKIYFCNGQSVGGYQTPDMRGRVPVGLTDGNMGGGALNPAVDPLVTPFTPNYQLGTITGANGITLSKPQMPKHNHLTSVTVTSPPHAHNLGITFGNQYEGGGTNGAVQNVGAGANSTTSAATLSFNTVVTVAEEGDNQAHSNVQPGIGCYYIMYIP